VSRDEGVEGGAYRGAGVWGNVPGSVCGVTGAARGATGDAQGVAGTGCGPTGVRDGAKGVAAGAKGMAARVKGMAAGAKGMTPGAKGMGAGTTGMTARAKGMAARATGAAAGATGDAAGATATREPLRLSLLRGREPAGPCWIRAPARVIPSEWSESRDLRGCGEWPAHGLPTSTQIPRLRRCAAPLGMTLLTGSLLRSG
jgi:hypothetical protein